MALTVDSGSFKKLKSFVQEEIRPSFKTTQKVFEYFYGAHNLEQKLNGIVLRDEFNQQAELSYLNYVLNTIKELLFKYSVIEVRISNSDGFGTNKTLDHTFILLKTDSQIMKIASYTDNYSTRCTEFNDYHEKLKTLLDSQPGAERLNGWNQLFEVNKSKDNDQSYLDVEVWYYNSN